MLTWENANWLKSQRLVWLTKTLSERFLGSRVKLSMGGKSSSTQSPAWEWALLWYEKGTDLPAVS